MYAIKHDAISYIAQAKIKADKKYINQLEQEIIEVIKADESMLLNYRIITSIKGIGPVNAWMTIAYTENFNSFTDGRKYAVFVGVIPFERSSGTSIKGPKRISHLAHKGLKQELNQAAKAAMSHDPEIGAYAERKLKNKAYPLVLNNVKFKLILRMFSLVKRGEYYVENYKKAA
jgi:transposase